MLKHTHNTPFERKRYQAPMSWEEFRNAPLDVIRPMMPATLLYAVGGTRRQAVLAGLEPDGEEYPRFAAEKMFEAFDRLVQYGAQHIVATVLQAPQLAEVGRYRERVLAWVGQLAEESALRVYRHYGWRVRMLGVADNPELNEIAMQLHNATPHGRATIWFYLSLDPTDHWRHVLAAGAAGATTQAEAIRHFCAEAIPPAELLIAFGKPLTGADIVPMILMAGTVQCYWTQRPGYDLPDEDLRRILYDALFTRKTWVADKRPRYNDVVLQRDVWEQGKIVGIGSRVGGFWYPYEEQHD
jgi:hypothetical protein